MTFGEYVRAIRCISTEENNPDTAIALLNIVTNKALDIPRSDKEKSNITSYIRAGRNIPEKFAKEIKGFYKSKFLRSYLTSTCTKNERKHLCDAFRKYCPEINDKNAINHSIRLFEEMLNSVITQERPESLHKKESKLSKKDLQYIQAIIMQMQSTMEKVLACSMFKKRTPQHRKEFDPLFEEFLMQNLELHNYFVIYPQLELIDTVFRLSRALEFSLRSDCQMNYSPGFYTLFNEYKNYLDQLIKTLHKQ